LCCFSHPCISGSRTTLEHNSDPGHAKNKQNYTPITIKLVATTDEHMEGLLSMFCQQVYPNRVITSLEPRSTEVIWIHTGAEPIALRELMSSRGHGCDAMSILFTHRICSQTHRLAIIRDKEIRLNPTVDRILDLHLRFGKRNLNEESPKSVRAKDNRDSHVPRVNQIGVCTCKERMARTRHARYTRKCPSRGPSVLVYWH
jgi:hypothetical protein